MLTSIFYYSHYKPFIFDKKPIIRTSDKIKDVYNSSSSSKAKNTEQGFSFLLNKMIKEDVVKYVSDVSTNVNDLKDSANFMADRVNNRRNGENIENYANGIEDFVNDFNKLKEFSESASKNSPTFSMFSDNLKDITKEHNSTISNLGISFDENGDMTFDRGVIEELGDEFMLKRDISSLFFKEVYDESCDFLSVPMVEHMNFKNLSYYYNYSYSGKSKDSGFNFIETGMVIDYVL